MALLSEAHSTNDAGHVTDHNTLARAVNDYYGVVTDNPGTGTTLAPDVGAGSVHIVNLPAGGAITVGPAASSTAPTYLAGQRACFIFVQAAGGGCTVAWDASWGRVPVVAAGASAVTIVEFVNIGATGAAPTWRNRSPQAASKGLLAARPAAAAVPSGHLYLATDDSGGRLSQSDGASWTQAGAGLSDASGQELAYAEITSAWTLTALNSTPVAVPGLSIVVPAGKAFTVECGGVVLTDPSSKAASTNFQVELRINDGTGWVANDTFRQTLQSSGAMPAGAGFARWFQTKRRVAALGAATTYTVYMVSNANAVSVQLYAAVGAGGYAPAYITATAH